MRELGWGFSALPFFPGGKEKCKEDLKCGLIDTFSYLQASNAETPQHSSPITTKNLYLINKQVDMEAEGCKMF